MPIPTLSLYETLTGHFSNGLPVGQVEPAEQRLLSILGTLQRLFASRQGALAHVPGFGLPDPAHMLDAQPAARQAMCRAVCEAIVAAEPRVLRAQATPLEQSPPGQLRIELHLELAGGGCQVLSTALTSHSPAVFAELREQGVQGPAMRLR